MSREDPEQQPRRGSGIAKIDDVGRFGEAAMFGGAPPGIRWRAVVPWVAGFFVYQWCAPTTLVDWWTNGLERVLHGWLHLPFPLVGDAA